MTITDPRLEGPEQKTLQEQSRAVQHPAVKKDPANRVIITDIDIPFGRVMLILFTWGLASAALWGLMALGFWFLWSAITEGSG